MGVCYACKDEYQAGKVQFLKLIYTNKAFISLTSNLYLNCVPSAGTTNTSIDDIQSPPYGETIKYDYEALIIRKNIQQGKHFLEMFNQPSSI